MSKTNITVTMPDGKPYTVKQLISSENAKLDKSNKKSQKYLTVGLSFAPEKLSGFQVCAHASAGCKAGCLFTAGFGRYQTTKNGRIARTLAFFQHRKIFLQCLKNELSKWNKKAKKQGKILACRLNVISDISWEKIDPTIFSDFPDIQYYDYTKHPNRKMPKNYDLTFSRSETNEKKAIELLRKGYRISVVFYGEIPQKWKRFGVINGDKHDLRFLEPKGKIVGLKAKGSARIDKSGFVVRL